MLETRWSGHRQGVPLCWSYPNKEGACQVGRLESNLPPKCRFSAPFEAFELDQVFWVGITRKRWGPVASRHQDCNADTWAVQYPNRKGPQVLPTFLLA